MFVSSRIPVLKKKSTEQPCQVLCKALYVNRFWTADRQSDHFLWFVLAGCSCLLSYSTAVEYLQPVMSYPEHNSTSESTDEYGFCLKSHGLFETMLYFDPLHSLEFRGQSKVCLTDHNITEMCVAIVAQSVLKAWKWIIANLGGDNFVLSVILCF